MRAILIVILAWVNGAHAIAQGSEEVRRTVEPDWVEIHDIPTFPESRLHEISEGTAYLLVDRQERWQPGGYGLYRRFAYELAERAALEEGGKIELSFDPALETLELTRLNVIRDGEIIDRRQTASIDIIRREERLTDNIMDGDRTAIIQLRDIRVGDIIDYATLKTTQTPLWPDANFGYVMTEWSVPVARQTSRILTPANRPLNFQAVETDHVMPGTNRDGWLEYKLEIEDSDPLKSTDNLPYSFVTYGYLSYSTMSGWDEVATIGQRIFDINRSLPDDYVARLDAIAAANTADADRIVAVLRLVQDEIRYLGFEGGIGGHKPRTPRVTLANGYGDCKDKSLLLVAALQHLGIDAAPAFASIESGWYIDREAPSISAFDHVIAQVVVDGRTYWLDPTMSYQGGDLDHLAPLDYGYALPLRPASRDLVLVSSPFPEQPNVVSVENYVFPEDGEIGMTLNVETEFRGAEADNMRYKIADVGRISLADDYINYYDEMYPGLHMTGPLDISDDLERNLLHIRESYELSREDLAAAKVNSTLSMRAEYVLDLLPDSVERQREAPLRLAYGVSQEHRINIHTPGHELSVPRSVSLDASGVEFSKTYERSGEHISAKFRIDIRERSALPADARAVVELEEEIANSANISFTLTDPQPNLLRNFLELLAEQAANAPAGVATEAKGDN